MRQYTVVLALVPVILAAWGCGGDGTTGCGDAGGSFFTGGDSNSGGGNSPASPANAVRANVAGDAFNYVVTGRYTAAGGTQKVDTSGTAAETYAANTFGGQASILDSLSTVITVGG